MRLQVKNHCGNKEADLVLGHVAADAGELCLPSQWAVSQEGLCEIKGKVRVRKEQPKCPSPHEQIHEMG